MKLKIGKKSGLKYFGYEDIKGWSPLYDLYKHISKDWRGTAIDILKIEEVSVYSRFWCVFRPQIVSKKTLRLFSSWCTRQVEYLMKDARGVEALDVAERFANKKATVKELRASYDAATKAADSARVLKNPESGREGVPSSQIAAAYAYISAAHAAQSYLPEGQITPGAPFYALDAYKSCEAATYKGLIKMQEDQVNKLIEMILAEGKSNRKVK